jgi:hypothetical protein
MSPDLPGEYSFLILSESHNNRFGMQMLDRNPKTRIGFSEILTHPVFGHLDWNRVAALEYMREFTILLWPLDAMTLTFIFSQLGVS